MKYLIFFFIFISLKSWSCAQKIDESKVMLFVDANFSDLEVETATKAACQRGERLVVVPQNFKSYTPQIKKIENSLSRLKRCQKDCDPIAQEYANAQMDLVKMREPQGELKDLIRKELAVIKGKNGKITNFLLSGHDGGGNFGGYKGGVSRENISDLMDEFKDINEVTTLMLLGCYTGVQKEIGHWKGIFPKVRMIGGYDGSAPLSDKPMGHHYLEDLLVKEKTLLKQADEKQLNQYVKANIRGLHSMHSAVYLEPVCADGSEADPMYYGSLTNKKFSSFDKNQCMKKAGKIKEINSLFSQFDSGEKEPPQNPSDPSIKSLYDQARSLEHCIEELESPMSVNSLFNLRFYGAVKENFATFYKNEISRAEAALAGTNLKEFSKNLDDELLKIETEEKQLAFDNERLTNDPQAFFADLEGRIQFNEEALNNILKDPEQRQALIRLQDPAYKATIQEEMLFEKYENLQKDIRSQQGKLVYRNTPNMLISINSGYADFARHDILERKKNFELLVDNKIWLPTHENLKKHSRKELRNNIHQMSALLTISNLPRKTRLALNWAVEAQSNHLIHFQNPFEWHEVTATVATPENKISIGASIPEPKSSSPFGFGLSTPRTGLQFSF